MQETLVPLLGQEDPLEKGKETHSSILGLPCGSAGKEFICNITHSQRNENQNHNEVPSHASKNGCDPKVYKQLMLERVWRKGNPLTQLVGMQTGTATMRNSVEIP